MMENGMEYLQQGCEQDGYIPFYDNAGVITAYADTNTGEMIESETVTVPRGSLLITPKELDAMTRKKEAYKQYKDNGDALKELGAFSFVSADNCFETLSPSHTVALVYLSTYLKHGTDELWFKRKQMKTTDLERVLCISKAGAYKFLNAVRPEFLIVDETGFIHLNQAVFMRGRGTSGKWFQRAYHECMQRLYLQTPVKRRKHLGYIFSILQYLNIADPCPYPHRSCSQVSLFHRGIWITPQRCHKHPCQASFRASAHIPP